MLVNLGWTSGFCPLLVCGQIIKCENSITLPSPIIFCTGISRRWITDHVWLQLQVWSKLLHLYDRRSKGKSFECKWFESLYCFLNNNTKWASIRVYWEHDKQIFHLHNLSPVLSVSRKNLWLYCIWSLIRQSKILLRDSFSIWSPRHHNI